MSIDPARVPTQPTVGYRTVFPIHGVDAVDVAERNVRSWLTQKLGRAGVLDGWDGACSERFNDQLSIVVVDLSGEGGTRRRLYRLIDNNPAGIFEISLFAASNTSNDGHIVIEGARGGVSTEEAIDGVATPNIVRQILEDVEVVDGATALAGRPRVVRSGQVQDVLDAILDERRAMSVIVASSIAPQVDVEWCDLIDQLTRFSVGVATTFVVHADAVDDLNQQLPDSLQIPRGRVRTFAPGVRLDNPDDGVIHRFLGPATLARSIRGGRIRGVLPAAHARGPRTRLLERAIPADARRTMDLLIRAERVELRALAVKGRLAATAESVDGSTSSETVDAPFQDADVEIALSPVKPDHENVSPEAGVAPSQSRDGLSGRGLPAFVTAVRALLRKWVRRDEVTGDGLKRLDRFIEGQIAEVEVATQQIDEVVSLNESLRRELEQLREVLDQRDLETALVTDEARELGHENQRLLRKLRDAHIFSAPDDSPIDWRPPTDVNELIARITPGEDQHEAYRRVVFTGKADTVMEVHKRDPYGKYARDLWDFVRVLFEYAELSASGVVNGNVHMYLTDDAIDGYKCSPLRHAGHESDSVLQNTVWRSERVRPVPVAVDPSGFALMDAHFKPTHRDMFAPRMHYYDDTNNTGKIYVGYIGKHLSTTQSS